MAENTGHQPWYNELDETRNLNVYGEFEEVWLSFKDGSGGRLRR